MSNRAAKRLPSDSTAAVDAFMAGLEHPHKSAIEELRLRAAALQALVRRWIRYV